MPGLSTTQHGRDTGGYLSHVHLDEHCSGFVDSQLRSGNYDSASAVVMAGLRLLEEENLKLAELRHALAEGEDSGAPEVFDNAAFLEEMTRKYGAS